MRNITRYMLTVTACTHSLYITLQSTQKDLVPRMIMQQSIEFYEEHQCTKVFVFKMLVG